MRKPIILDTTLRDGEQSPGLYFTHKEKIHIAQELDNLGIDIIEAGIPSMGNEERTSLKEIKKLNLKSEILSWNRLLIKDVIASLDAGITNIHLSVSTSDIMLENKLRKKREWLFSQMEQVFNFAIKEGATISFGAEDASRTDSVFLKKIFLAAQHLGAQRIRFADTLGIMTPTQISSVLPYLSSGLCIPIDFHGHNDFGMATANALSAWENGADIISCSLLGLGERAGNTSLEELMGVMRYLKSFFQDFDFVRLSTLCKRISSWIGNPIPAFKPLIGERVYSHESGIHVDGLLKNPSTYEFFPPEHLGEIRKLVLGKHSGKKAVKYLADLQGFKIKDHQVDEFLSSLRKEMASKRGVNSDTLFNNYLDRNGRRVIYE